MPLEAVIAGTEFTELRIHPDGSGRLSWIANSPDGAELRIGDANGVERHLLDPLIAAGRGNGGGAYDWCGDGSAIVYAAKSGALIEYTPNTRSSRIIRAGDGRDLAGVAVHAGRVACVADSRTVMIVNIANGRTKVIDDSQDFAFDPAWVTRGLVWTAWNIPHMPWESSGVRMWSAWRARWYVKPGDSQVQQVRPAPRGGIGCISDQGGWLNVSRISGSVRGRVAPMVKEDHEHADPTWGMGQRSWAVYGANLFYTRNEDGFGRLICRNVETGVSTEIGKGIYESLCAGDGFVAAIRSGAKTPGQIVIYSGDLFERTVIDTVGDYSAYAESLVEPEVLQIEGVCVRRYMPSNPNGRHLMWVHGGPTDQWQVEWFPKLNYWLSRGYTIHIPDHRGTTGHGRSFQQSLLGHWGEHDSDDVARVIRHLGVASENVALLGGSAGGMTALNVAADHPGIAACVIVSYPVTDLEHLAATSHRFERHSVHSLVGDAAEMKRRSPINKCPALASIPLLVLHGDNDPVVPIEQGRAIVDGVRAVGGTAALEVMSGEGHGFRKPENKKREYTRIEEFLNQHMGTVRP